MPWTNRIPSCGRYRKLALAIACALSTGCIVVPHRGKVYGPGGSAGSVDLRFLNSGTTLRDEVRDRLKIIDLGIPESALFWGRWRRQWNVYWFAAGAGQTTASAGGGKETVWRRRNLIVEFDSAGKVMTLHSTGDSDLLRELAGALQRTRGQREPAGTELTLVSLAGERISLKGGRISFSGIRAGEPRFACDFASLSALKVNSDSEEDLISLRLETSISRSMGRRVQRRFSLTPQQVYELVKFAEANGLGRILGGPADDAAQ